jgi:hypothetical protein
VASTSQIWVITSYYNPKRYRRRLENFRHFRNALRSPLLVVELGYRENFELSDGDANILLQMRGESVLWQKERLLNVAISRLPEHVHYIAWLDCDVVFSEASWAESAVEALQNHCLIQPFETLIGLGPTSTHQQIEEVQHTGKSWASTAENGGLKTGDFPIAREPGFAWAGHRSLLEKHGIYDGMILGSGDSAFAYAAYGRFGELPYRLKFNQARTNHYLDWARPFFDDVRGNVGHLKGDIFHYWHGDRAERRYVERDLGLAPFNFDPHVDIKIDDRGCFKWSTHKPELHDYVRNYWNLRKEDGPATEHTQHEVRGS